MSNNRDEEAVSEDGIEVVHDGEENAGQPPNIPSRGIVDEEEVHGDPDGAGQPPNLPSRGVVDEEEVQEDLEIDVPARAESRDTFDLTQWRNRNLLCLAAVAFVGCMSTTVLGVLYGRELLWNNRTLQGGEDFPSPVILKLAKMNYSNHPNYERMIIRGYDDPSLKESPGILQWRNQSGFWYLEVSPKSSTLQDCPVRNFTSLFTRYEQTDGFNAPNISSCNLYDFRLVIFNDLGSGATVHFHGLAPPSSEDGVPFIATANIHPQNLQSYRFKQFTYPGFHWMHAHTGFGQAFGVAAPIVLQHGDEYFWNNEFKKEDDLIVMFEEGFLYPKCAYSGRWWYVKECTGSGIPESDFAKLSLFINRGEKPLEYEPKTDDVKKLRIRFLNGGSEAPWRINGTNITTGMEILATDGDDVERGVKRDIFVLGLANRIDVLVDIDPDRDVLITGIQMKHSGDVRDPALRHIVIRGRNTPPGQKINSAELPAFAKGVNSPILENFDLFSKLTSARPLLYKKEPDKSYTVWNKGGDQFGGFPLTIFKGLLSSDNLKRISREVGNYTALNQLKFQLPPYKTYRNKKTNVAISTRRACDKCTEMSKSGIVQRPPKGEGLYNIPYHNMSKTVGTPKTTCCWEWCDYADNCTDFELEDVKHYEPNHNYIPVCFGDRVKIMFVNTASFEGQEGHPMHLHGHEFVLTELYNVTDGGKIDQASKITYDVTGPKVDTIWVPFGQAVTFEFDAFNPGEHLFHCHNDFHLTNGMMTTVRYMHENDFCDNRLPQFNGGESDFPTQICTMDNCTPTLPMSFDFQIV